MSIRQWIVLAAVLAAGASVWAAAKDSGTAAIDRRLGEVEKRLDKVERQLSALAAPAEASVAMRLDRLEAAMSEARETLRQAERRDLSGEIKRLDSALADTRRATDQLERGLDAMRREASGRGDDTLRDLGRAVDALKDATSDLKTRVVRLESK